MVKKLNKNNPLSVDQVAEIDALRANTSKTIRPVAEGIEKILYKVFPALDHGFIREIMVYIFIIIY